ncbi:hypothetical protein [Streptomyces fagopyri]
MTTDTDAARPENHDHQELRLLTLTLTVGLLITAATVYVACVHAALNCC